MNEEITSAGLDKIFRKVTLHLIPLIFICYLFNYLDRTNVGFAKLQMLDALKMSSSAYGFGAGIFFIGYVICGVPSNLIMRRVGARRWMGILMIVWGLLSASLMFIRTPNQFYVLRFLTGVAEAGFFPGMVIYLSQWYPSVWRGRAIGLFMSAIPLSGVLGSPLSGWMLQYFSHGQGGIGGWQWLYLLQGMPTAILGALLFVLLPDRVEDVHWLSNDEKTAARNALTEDEASKPVTAAPRPSLGQVLTNPSVWKFGVVYFTLQMGVYAINFWMPTLIKSLGFNSTVTIGWLSAIPYLAATVLMIAVGKSADARRERRYHLSGPMLVSMVGFVLASLTSHPGIAMVGLTLAAAGAVTGLAMFWPLPTAVLSGITAAAGVAFINSLGQIAGFVSPYIAGWIQDTMHNATITLYLLSGAMVIGIALVLHTKASQVNR